MASVWAGRSAAQGRADAGGKIVSGAGGRRRRMWPQRIVVPSSFVTTILSLVPAVDVAIGLDDLREPVADVRGHAPLSISVRYCSRSERRHTANEQPLTFNELRGRAL
jgi:hypothetical protein